MGKDHLIVVRDPGRLSDVVAEVRVATPAQIEQRVQEAEMARPSWAQRSVGERAGLLRAAADWVDSIAVELAPVLTRENGAVLPVSQRELMGAARIIRAAVEHGEHVLGSDPVRTGAVVVHRRPYGVVACIVPWNAPVTLAMQKVAPALITGNAVVVKPSPDAPVVVTRVLERIAAILPPGVLSVVNGGGDVGAALVADRRVRKVSFTGGGAVAREIMRLAADDLTRVHFELGGNDPAILLDDADVAVVAPAIGEAAFRRSGQVCFAVKRVYVPRHRVHDFTDAVLAHLDRSVIGHGLEPETTMGPVSNAAQFDRIRFLREDHLSRGGRLEFAGTMRAPEDASEGYYLRPAVARDADPADELVVQEQFGPILPIVGYDSVEDAIAMANGTEYGLCSSVWSADAQRAESVARRVEAGISFINRHSMTEVGQRTLPFGGVKQSGIGWENSTAGLDEYLQYHGLHLEETA